MTAIIVNNLGKAYKKYDNRWSRFFEWMIPGSSVRHQLKWILQGISFVVNSGEAVGIIGINGAGKSTLLKLITGTIQPTSGEVKIHGRVAAMLELGLGFHPDFTGRQNVYMAGQLLGLRSEDITRLFPEILEFSEIGDYIDQPVRVYSSGMQVRLAFSVATAVRPDVLIVDEALSVGDTYFQHKSFNRIREFRKQGTTLLIVSHDKGAIQSICDRAILIDHGVLAKEGDPEVVLDYYNAMLADGQDQAIVQNVMSEGKAQTTSGTGEAVLENLALLSEDGAEVEVVNVGQRVILRAIVNVKAELEKLVFGYSIKDRLGQVIYGTNTALTGQILENVLAGSRWEFDVEFPANLGEGSFSIQTALCSSDTHLINNYEWRDLALVFSVVNVGRSRFDGVAWIEPRIGIDQL